ncbi:MAG: chorismate mutase [Acidimicrobiales bacterium]|jgi:chorismate mutase
MTPVLRAIRGATTLERDSVAQVDERVRALVTTMLERNRIKHDDIVSILFTATDDIVSMFPAAAARSLGLGDVPLMCARELGVVDARPLCVRVLMHFYTEAPRQGLHHVYLEGARGLRDDLPD